MKYLYLLVISFLVSGCATIINGKTQKIEVTSKPPGAVVEVGGLPAGTTPLKIEVPRNKDHTVFILKEGYRPNITKLKRSLSGVVIFYLLPGGLVSLGIDATQGSAFAFQNSVKVLLHPLFDPTILMAMELAILKAVVEKGSAAKQKPEEKKASTP